MKQIFFLIIINLITLSLIADNHKGLQIDDSERTDWDFLLSQKPNWYQSNEAQRVADNMILLERTWGGWPKNINAARHFSDKEVKEILSAKENIDATIDNGTTFTHLRYLAKVYNATKDKKYGKAFQKGFNYLIEAQYTNGGWPQFYPPKKGYYTHITFNDDAMIGVMQLMSDIAQKKTDFSFLDNSAREKAKTAVEKGIDVILKTQIVINGKLTAWCAQHDEHTLKPANARSYELISISGKESISIIEYLMKIENPSPEIKKAIISACQWFEDAKITGYKLEFIKDSTAAEGFNRILVPDKNGPDLWARFYNIETGQPYWVDREGVICKTYNEISYERRNNYAFVQEFAHELLLYEFPEWKRRNGLK
ncbi:MAG: pectate lyase [Prolixibacteraceae bacterium]